MTENPKLKPCQCGNIPEQMTDLEQDGSYKGRRVEWIECSCGMKTIQCNDIDEAITIWNNRPAMIDADKLIAELEKVQSNDDHIQWRAGVAQSIAIVRSMAEQTKGECNGLLSKPRLGSICQPAR